MCIRCAARTAALRAGNYRWHSLDDARGQCGLDLPNAHRAHADTLLARAVLHFVAAQR